MNKKLSFIVMALCLWQSVFSQSDEKTLFFISNSHLDTQWNWDVKTTIDQYILNTMTQNFPLLNKYPGFHFNFEAAIHYKWMKEYYPAEYARVKEYIKSGRWNISGGSVNANDVMVSSAESIIRNFLYGQAYYKNEFGRKGGSDIMLPDCFGFPYSLPTLGKHCGVTGFHTAKLAWGSAYNYDSLAPFGIWKGVDGSEIYAIFKGEPYDEHEKYNKDMSKDTNMLNIINSHQAKYGVSGAFRYVGPRSDRGGGLQDNPGKEGENTPYWLQTSVDSDGPVTVKMATPDEIFKYLDENRNDKYFVWDNELPMAVHGTGCYSSQAILKYWNRKNELLADATEKTSVLADWLGGLNYPSDIIRESWIRILWHQFHDDLPGTALPSAYNFSYNDAVLVNLDLSKTLLNSVGAVVRQMNTQVDGIPVVVYNPLSIERTDIVEASVLTKSKPSAIRVLDTEGKDVLAQITDYDAETGKLSFIFKSTVPSLGYVTYELRLNERKSFDSPLRITNNSLENDLYKIGLNSKGEVASIFDKEQNTELLTNAIRLALFNDRSESWPAWEIMWNDVNSAPIAYVDENVDISIEEDGPLRISLKVSRKKNGSDFVQYIRLTPGDISKRIDFVNEIDWQCRGTMLKAVFPLRASNPKATYDLSIGAIERGINASNLYEVSGHQWADQTHTDGTYGISILNDCKYGWDKPDNTNLRLTLIHTPAVSNNYTYHKDQDLGLNKFTYSFYRHMGGWNEETQWEASKLNQPLLAFQAPKHAGALGKLFGFASMNTGKVSVKALKKAEESDELIIRVYELTGYNQDNVKISLPANIISAREVNGIEEEVGTVSYTNNSLSFNIGRFQPKTFAVKMAAPATTVSVDSPSSVKVNLDYNVDVMSFDSWKNNVTTGVKYAYPAELLSDVIVADGIEFTIGDRRDGNKNAVQCAGQSISLPANKDNRKVYILAGSRKEEGSLGNFKIDGVSYPLSIPYYAGNVGVWATEYNLGTEYRRENVAYTATHRHNVNDGRNDSYNFMYMYKYAIPVDGKASTLVLPDNQDIYVFAVSMSDNANDDITGLTSISSLPGYTDSGIDTGTCNRKLEASSVRASHQNGAQEGPNKAIDGDLNTKWCVTNNDNPWLELTFDEPVEICRWFVMNAGTEDFNYITSGFRLQRFENGQWIDVDVVRNNTINKVSRSVNPFTANRVRLQIDKGEQKGTTTRILEFAVFGDNLTSIDTPQTAGNSFYIKGNYPNPLSTKTTIQCMVPETITELNLHVYDLSGRLVNLNTYYFPAGGGLKEIEWNSQSVDSGIYLYAVSAIEKGRMLCSGASKMTVNKSNP